MSANLAVVGTTAPTKIVALLQPYRGMCFGSNRTIVELLDNQANYCFAFVRIEPITGIPERLVQNIFQELVPRLCQIDKLWVSIQRQVDLHLLTPWTYPIVITIVGKSKTDIETNLKKLLYNLRTCLSREQIERFRNSWDKDHQEWADGFSAMLLESVQDIDFKVEPALVRIYSREAVEDIMSLFLDPHSNSIYRGSSVWD